MGWYNLFTLDENGNPTIISVETDNEQLAGTTQFDETINTLPDDIRQEYFKQIAQGQFKNVTIEPQN